MLVKISINPEGMEQLLKNGEARLYGWHLTLTTPAIGEMPTGNILITEVDITLPNPEQLVPAVMTKLREREAEVQAEAHQEMMSIRQRRNDILMLNNYRD